MHRLRRAARILARVLYVVLVATISVCVPVLPIVFMQKKWRDREIAAQIERKR